MREKLYRFMQGRYGIDDLGRFSMIVTLILIVVSIFWRNLFLNIATWILLIWTYYRMLSRNTGRRYSENLKYLNIKNKLTGRKNSSSSGNAYSNTYSNYGNAYSKPGNNRKASGWWQAKPQCDRDHKIYRCPSCGQWIRVPKGKGKIAITCSKCRNEFVKRT